ncbi:hypothetical protein KAR91_01350 [Candidatus Pacearchaeota archaeon]|nr:hypothetical protein [Candidatus Pacearchaeota archaeon]
MTKPPNIGDYTEEQGEFLRAVGDYRTRTGRHVLRVTDYLLVLRDMGYRRSGGCNTDHPQAVA